jgi:hypothetical protein
MKKLLFLLALWPGVVFGQTVGCFKSTNSDDCLNSEITIGNCRYYNNMLYSSLGVAVGSLCNKAINASDGWDKCSAGWDGCLKGWEAESAKLKANARSQSSLVSKLRKACGNRCKTIK